MFFQTTLAKRIIYVHVEALYLRLKNTMSSHIVDSAFDMVLNLLISALYNKFNSTLPKFASLFKNRNRYFYLMVDIGYVRVNRRSWVKKVCRVRLRKYVKHDNHVRLSFMEEELRWRNC